MTLHVENGLITRIAAFDKVEARTQDNVRCFRRAFGNIVSGSVRAPV